MDWKQVAHQVGELGPDPRSLDAVHHWISEHPEETRWGVACSGGADSVYLLLWLWYHYFRHGKVQGIVLHYNHRIRGAEADADAQWVTELAQALELRVCSGQSETAQSKGRGESELRDERHGFFYRELNAQGARVLLTGHQAEDVAEWMMMRLARGSGVAGLSGPRPVQTFISTGMVHLRPLLGVSREQIRERLRDCGATWREDFTNAQDLWQRNALRNQVLPVWKEAEQRPLMEGIGRSRALLEEEDQALEQYLQEWTKDVDWAADRLKWGKSLPPRALLRRAWFRWARRHPALLNRGSEFVERVLRTTEGRESKWSQQLGTSCTLHVMTGEWRVS